MHVKFPQNAMPIVFTRKLAILALWLHSNMQSVRQHHFIWHVTFVAADAALNLGDGNRNSNTRPISHRGSSRGEPFNRGFNKRGHGRGNWYVIDDMNYYSNEWCNSRCNETPKSQQHCLYIHTVYSYDTCVVVIVVVFAYLLNYGWARLM